jgi:excisionase family DNA binding protein
MLTISEAAEYLGLSSRTLRKWTDAGIVKAGRIPPRGDRRFTQAELQRVRREVMGMQE